MITIEQAGRRGICVCRECGVILEEALTKFISGPAGMSMWQVCGHGSEGMDKIYEL
jgi:hypothetical protein